MSGADSRAAVDWRFLGVVLASFGGPLALAALYAPGAIGEVTSSGGLVVLAAAVGFASLLAIWLRFNRDVASPGGLSAFIEAGTGRRIALVHAAVWTGSYLLYVVYTSGYVADELLPGVWSGAARHVRLMATLLALVVAAVAVAGRVATLRTLAVLGFGQVALLLALDVVAVRHAPAAAAFHPVVNADTSRASASLAGLLVCGSLPLFLAGDVRSPQLQVRRALPTGFLVAAAGVLLAVYPLARDPAFARAAAPGVALVRADVGSGAAHALAVGVAASVLAVLLLELVALSRLFGWATGRPPTLWVRWLAAALLVAAGVTDALGPDRVYDALVRPSLVLLWVAQLGVVLAFPVFLYRRGRLRAWHLGAAFVAVAVTAYALVSAVGGGSST